MAESDTWEGRENLENAKEAVEEFEKVYWRDMEEINWQERKEETFRRGELPGRFIARKLFGWSDKQYDQDGEGWKETGKNRREKEEH